MEHIEQLLGPLNSDYIELLLGPAAGALLVIGYLLDRYYPPPPANRGERK